MCPRAHVSVSMYACVHTYMCVSLCGCAFMCVHVCAYLLMCLYICVPLCESAHPCVHVCVYVNVSMFRVQGHVCLRASGMSVPLPSHAACNGGTILPSGLGLVTQAPCSPPRWGSWSVCQGPGQRKGTEWVNSIQGALGCKGPSQPLSPRALHPPRSLSPEQRAGLHQWVRDHSRHGADPEELGSVPAA